VVDENMLWCWGEVRVRGIRVSTWYELESTQEAFSYLRYIWADVSERVAVDSDQSFPMVECCFCVLGMQAAEMMYLPKIFDDTDLAKRPIKPLRSHSDDASCLVRPISVGLSLCFSADAPRSMFFGIWPREWRRS
jgi:hypothetical protein